jgi:hypothetical protein
MSPESSLTITNRQGALDFACGVIRCVLKPVSASAAGYDSFSERGAAMPAKNGVLAKKTAATGRRMIVAGTPNDPNYTTRVDAAKYEAMRRTMMKLLPRKAPGLTQAEMWDALAP